MRRKDRTRQLGTTLLEAVVGSAIVGIVAVGVTAFMSTMTKLNSDGEVLADQEDLRAYIGSKLACGRTVASFPTSCATTDQMVNAYDAKGKVLASKTGTTKIGPFGLRVSCKEAGTRLLVETSAPKRVGSEDSPGATTFTAGAWQDLYRGIPVFLAADPKQGVIDFEAPPFNVPNRIIRDKDDPDYLTDPIQLWDNYSVNIRTIDDNGNPTGSNMVIRRTTREDESQPDDSEEAWLCAKCPGSPSKNRLKDQASEEEVGRYILSTTDATTDKSLGVQIDYKTPVYDLEFNLIDIDGAEEWEIQAYTQGADGLVPINEASAKASLKGTGYGADSFTGKPFAVPLSATEPIYAVRLFGDKKIKYFGFAFDKFRTGVEGSCLAPMP